jgi:hypothetical protein
LVVCRHQSRNVESENAQVHVGEAEEEEELAQRSIEVVDTGASVGVWMKNRDCGGSNAEGADVDLMLWQAVFVQSEYRTCC